MEDLLGSTDTAAPRFCSRLIWRPGAANRQEEPGRCVEVLKKVQLRGLLPPGTRRLRGTAASAVPARTRLSRRLPQALGGGVGPPSLPPHAGAS